MVKRLQNPGCCAIRPVTAPKLEDTVVLKTLFLNKKTKYNEDQECNFCNLVETIVFGGNHQKEQGGAHASGFLKDAIFFCEINSKLNADR